MARRRLFLYHPAERSPIDHEDKRRDLDLDEHEGIDMPHFRATIRKGRLRLHDWSPFLLSGGPSRELFRSRRDDGVSIADIRRWRTEDGSAELSVEFLSGGGRPAAERVIERWARLAGYSRLWLPERVVELDADGPAELAAVGVRCPSCRACWNDGNADFWHTVKRSGSFPRTCPVCGGELPQWQLAEADDPSQAAGSPSSAR